jgi:hypothetical protein
VIKKKEVHDLAVFDLVGLSLDAQLAGGFQGGLAAVLFQVGDAVDLGADEALFEVGVDHAGGLGYQGALAHGPGANLPLPAVKYDCRPSRR